MKAGMRITALALAGLATAAGLAAHELRPAYLELIETAPGRVRVVWKQPVVGEVALPLAPGLPETWTEVEPGRLTRTPDALVRETLYDPAGPLAGQRIGIDGLAASLTDALVRVTLADGTAFTEILRPSSPSFVIRAAAAPPPKAEYLVLGVKHILLGVDHLLFVLGLLVIVGGRWLVMLKTITAFTVAHSLTLAAATLGIVRVPSGPVNAAIALSILFLGLEVARQRRGATSFTIERPWVAAFGFGLLHGFGFASGLADLGLPPAEIPWALLLFNVGVELGQLAFVGLYLALRRSLAILEVPAPRWAEEVPGYVVGTLGAYWTIVTTTKLLGLGG